MQRNNSPGPVCLKRQPIAFCQGSGRAGDSLLTIPAVVYYNVRHEENNRTNNQGAKKRIGLEPSPISGALGTQQALYSQGRNRADQESGDLRGEEDFPSLGFEVGRYLVVNRMVYYRLHNISYATQAIASTHIPACTPLPQTDYEVAINGPKLRVPTRLRALLRPGHGR